jgi:hypothetical protein
MACVCLYPPRPKGKVLNLDGKELEGPRLARRGWVGISAGETSMLVAWALSCLALFFAEWYSMLTGIVTNLVENNIIIITSPAQTSRRLVNVLYTLPFLD